DFDGVAPRAARLIFRGWWRRFCRVLDRRSRRTVPYPLCDTHNERCRERQADNYGQCDAYPLEEPSHSPPLNPGRIYTELMYRDIEIGTIIPGDYSPVSGPILRCRTGAESSG